MTPLENYHYHIAHRKQAFILPSSNYKEHFQTLFLKNNGLGIFRSVYFLLLKDRKIITNGIGL